MTTAAPETVALLGVAVDEAAVRRLCGSAFAQADAFQRAGHVLGPAIAPHGLTGRVRGTWRRIDPVSVQVRGGKLLPECGRDGAGCCRHAGALLLHWLRDPSAFAVATVADPEDDDPDGAGFDGVAAGAGAVSPLDAPVETPEAELARLLERDTVPHLREVARRRGLRPSGTKKADLVRHLAPALADPAGIDAALATLSRIERAALDALHLATEPAAAPGAIEAAFELLGERGKPPVAAAFDAGLAAIARQPYYGSPEPGYAVPAAVAARLPTLEGLIAARSRPGPADPGDGAAPLGVIEVLQTVAAESLAGDLGALAVPPPTIVDAYLPPGFVLAPEEAERLAAANPRQMPVSPDGFRLAPLPILETAVRDRLAATTGCSGPAVEFLFRLLLTLEVAEPEPRLAILPDRWRAFLDRPPGDRLARLVEAWLLTADLPNEDDPAAETGGGLRARWHPTYANWSQPHQSAILAAARLTARLIGRMAPDRWHDIGELAGAVERLAPTAAPALVALRTVPATAQAVSWWGVTGRGKEERLALRPEEGWSRFVRGVVGDFLTGPLAWLGLVEIAGRSGASAAFRVRPAAGILVGRAWVPERPVSAAPGHLVVGDDLSVLVPAGTTDAAVHGLLARAGELVGTARDGLRYRLTPAGLHAVFEAGGTGPGFAADLAARAGGSLPAAVTAALERWWDGYGAVRLYDELTLIEFGDDVLLKELLASTALGAFLVHAFSPRLVAILPERAETVVADLTARGYAPRVVEG